MQMSDRPTLVEAHLIFVGKFGQVPTVLLPKQVLVSFCQFLYGVSNRLRRRAKGLRLGLENPVAPQPYGGFGPHPNQAHTYGNLTRNVLNLSFLLHSPWLANFFLLFFTSFISYRMRNDTNVAKEFSKRMRSYSKYDN